MAEEWLFAGSDKNEQAEEPERCSQNQTWNVLIVDDDESVHHVTRMVLSDFVVLDRKLNLLSCFSGMEAKQLMSERNDIAVVLLDVVMETESAGLEVADYIRNQLHNLYTRIVLRTGQPGEAPEETVIREYDINDYKDKTELTSIKLKTLLYSTVRSYRDICTLNQSRKGLRKVIDAISHVNESRNLRKLASAVLDEIINLLGLHNEALYFHKVSAYAASIQNGTYHVLAASGELESALHANCIEQLPTQVREGFELAIQNKQSQVLDSYSVFYTRSTQGSENLLYLQHDGLLTDLDRQLLEIYATNVGLTYENLLIREEVEATQKELVLILGEAVECRSLETGAHVKRVGKMAKFLALKLGIDAEQADVIEYAAPLHDIGKVGIPDAVLEKPGKLDGEERRVMMTHSKLGEKLLDSSERKILKVAAKIAGQHHEHWDGSGYPNGYVGEQIDIAARITGLCDVVDALASVRCYKQAWSYEAIQRYLEDKAGSQFDPQLVTLLLNHYEEIKAIRAEFPDPS